MSKSASSPPSKSSPPQSIALHLGAHKTASTHLQRMLHRNRSVLREDGIRYIGPGDLRRPGRSLGAMFDLSWSEDVRSSRTPKEELIFVTRGYKRMVFSEENFVGTVVDRDGTMAMPLYPNAAPRVKELVSTWAPIKPQLFLGIRNPAAYMASVYSQALYGKHVVGPRTFRARNDWQQIDWADYVARLRAISGVDEIYVWTQEEYQATKRLIFRRMLRWRTGGRLELSDETVHPGLSSPAVRQTLAWAQEGRDGELAKEARRRFPLNETNTPFTLYAASTLAKADALYADQIARIDAMDGVTLLRPPQKDAIRYRKDIKAAKEA